MLHDIPRTPNPTASVSTSPGSILRDRDFTAAGCLASQKNAARRGKLRGPKTTQYVGTIQSPLYNKRDDDSAPGAAPANSGKPRSLLAGITAAVEVGAVRLEDLDDKTRSRVERRLYLSR